MTPPSGDYPEPLYHDSREPAPIAQIAGESEPDPAVDPPAPDDNSTPSARGRAGRALKHPDFDEHESRTQAAVERELHRMQSYVQVLQAQAHVLSKDYSALVHNVALSGATALKTLTDRIAADARWVEDGMGGTMRDQMLAAVGAVKPTGPVTNSTKSNIKSTAERSIEYAKAIHDLHRAHRIADVYSQELDMSQTKRAYLHSLDTTETDLPSPDSHLSIWNVEADRQEEANHLPSGRKVFFRLSRKLLEGQHTDGPAQPTVDESEPFFADTKVMAVDTENGFRYQSLKANLTLEGSKSKVTIESIVDSGAAWCAIRRSTLEKEMPELMEKLEPSSMRFHDASGRLMSLAGRVPLKVWIGARFVTTTAYVFDNLGAPFLLGANALLGNGCVVDCNKSRLYVANDPTHGIPMHSAWCTSCEPRAHTDRFTPEWQACVKCPTAHGTRARIVCDKENSSINLMTESDNQVIASVHCSPTTYEPAVTPRTARLVLDEEAIIQPNEIVTLAPRMEGVAPDSLAPIELQITDALRHSGLTLQGESAVHNPTNRNCPLLVRNDTLAPIRLPGASTLMTQIAFKEEDSVLVAAVIDEGPSRRTARHQISTTEESNFLTS